MQPAPKPKKLISKSHANVKGVVLPVQDDPFLRSEIVRTPGCSFVPSIGEPCEGWGYAAAVVRGARLAPSVAPCSPSSYGLGLSSYNYDRAYKRLGPMAYDLIDLPFVIRKFREMKLRERGKWVMMINKETKEVKSFKSSSRWNDEGNRQWKVRRKLLRAAEQFSTLKMLTLTFDQSLIDELIKYSNLPVWMNVKHWLAVAAWEYLNDFLDRLRLWMSRNGYRWSYLFAVLEPHESGAMHFHLAFHGRWIAPIAVLREYWNGSKQSAGVEISKGEFGKFRGKHKRLAHYLTKYLSKGGGGKSEEVDALRWHFKVRDYNINHGPRAKMLRVTRAQGEGAECSPWAYADYMYREPDDGDKAVQVDRFVARENRARQKTGDGDDDDSEWNGSLTEALAKVAAMPVLYPDQVPAESKFTDYDPAEYFARKK